MPIYEYKAYVKGGSLKTGVIDADSPREARQRLRRDNILVKELSAKGKSKAKAKPPLIGKFKGLLKLHLS